jgi:hypothetical protein
VSDSPSANTPERIEWTGGPPPKRREPRSADFYRAPIRVGILALLAPIGYFYWWFWQFFLFARRERFARSRAFWWMLVPIYGWAVIYRLFEDLDREALARRLPGLPPGLVIVLLFLSYLATLAFNSRSVVGLYELAFFLIAAAITSTTLLLGQRAANAYIKNQYPDAEPAGMTWGEITATALGVLLNIVIILDSLLPA